MLFVEWGRHTHLETVKGKRKELNVFLFFWILLVIWKTLLNC